DGLVRFGRQGTVRHRASREAAHDRLGGFDLVDRDRAIARGHQEVAQLQRRASVDERSEAVVVAASKGVRGLLQGVDDWRARGIRLAALSELDVAGVLELGRATPLEDLALQLREPDASDR